MKNIRINLVPYKKIDIVSLNLQSSLKLELRP